VNSSPEKRKDLEVNYSPASGGRRGGGVLKEQKQEGRKEEDTKTHIRHHEFTSSSHPWKGVGKVRKGEKKGGRNYESYYSGGASEDGRQRRRGKERLRKPTRTLRGGHATTHRLDKTFCRNSVSGAATEGRKE